MPELDSAIISQILRKNGIPESSAINRYTSGITNKAYGVEDNYVIKLEGELEGVLTHQKEITDKLLSVGANVPRILDAGVIGGKHYLLMEKVRGENIVYGWLKFSIKQKENFIAQIAEELKKFHSIKFDEYAIRIASGPRFPNLKDAVARIVDFSRIAKDKLEPAWKNDVDLLEEFYQRNLPILNETNTAVLVHNDLNLENIFYEGEKITGIIDFDWVCQAPRDFELWKIAEVFRDPQYTVEERLEPLYENYKMTEEFGFLKKHYPNLFEAPNLADRIRIYYLEKMIDRVVDYQSGTAGPRAMQIFQEEVQDVFKGSWLDDMVKV